MKLRASNWLAVALLLVFSSASFSQSVIYPSSKGAVSDYADKLSGAQVAELNALIRDFQRQTSIEIAVVIVDSLQGLSAREYAIGIGNSWRVGKADRNNGVVVLWAPNERAYSLRIADGLSQDLSDSDATDITHNDLVPNFKREAYYEGLKDTVVAVMRRLGNESWQERLELRQQKSQSTPAWLIPAVVAGLGISTVVFVILHRRAKRDAKLKEMGAVPDSIAQNLRVAKENAPRIQQQLDNIKKEMPEQDLTQFSTELAGQPNRMAKIETDMANLNPADLTSYAEVLEANDRSKREANLLSSTRQKLDDIRQAKTQGQLIMQKLSKESFQISDVRDLSKKQEVDNLLFNSRSLYDKAHYHCSTSVFDWIYINNLLNSSQRQIQQATQVSQAEPYIPPPTFDSSSAFTSDASTAGSGGDFGGGGGFSGGSGSDGSY